MKNTLAIARPLPSPVPQEITDLADRSLDIGYRVLANRIQKVNAFHEGATLLKGIGIGVYDPKSVNRYKTLALIKAKYLMHVKYLVFTILLLPVAYAFALLCKTFKDPSMPGVAFGVLAGIAVIGAIFFIVAYIVKTVSNEYRLEWTDSSIESYDKPIPEDAIRTAINIRETLPQIELFVEELHARRRVVDPFLYVLYKGVRLYVSVWNEPKFLGKML